MSKDYADSSQVVKTDSLEDVCEKIEIEKAKYRANQALISDSLDTLCNLFRSWGNAKLVKEKAS